MGWAGDEVAVLVGRDHRDVVYVQVDELKTEFGRSLVFNLRPGSDAATGVRKELARCNRLICGIKNVLTQEHLVRRMRGVGLALVHERGVGVRRAAVTVRVESVKQLEGGDTIVPRVKVMNANWQADHRRRRRCGSALRPAGHQPSKEQRLCRYRRW